MKKIRLLLTLYSTANGGAEESINKLLNYITTKYGNVKVSFLLIRTYDLDKPNFNKNVKVYSYKISMKIYKYLAPFIILYICIKDHINLVNHNFRFIYEESLASHFLKIKNLSTIRAIFIDRNNANEFKYIQNVVGVSNAVTDRIKELGYKGNLFTIYNGIDFKNFNDFHNLYDLKSPLKILSMGRLVEWKRHDWSIKAIKILREKGYEVSLDIYGEGSEEEQLKSLVKDLNVQKYIRINNYIDVNNSSLAQFGTFLLPSFAEPFSKTIMENVLREKVIIGTDYGGTKEVLVDYDLLFSRDEFDNYVNMIEKALNNHEKYLLQIKNIKTFVSSYYTIDRVCEDYYNLYSKLL